MNCPYCGTENPNYAISCQKCGKGLEVDEYVQCSNCHTENPYYVKYCRKCGRVMNQWDIKPNKWSEPYKIGSIISFMAIGLVFIILILFWAFWF